MEGFIVVAVVAILYLFLRGRTVSARRKAAQRDDFRPQTEEADDVEMPNRTERLVVEILGEDGVPAFRFRFNANLEFTTSSEALRNHRVETFIPRPNGNTDPIQDGNNGYWLKMHEWDADPMLRMNRGDDRFKYIGGEQAYIDFLLKVRAVYEDQERSPESKRNQIKRICDQNHNVYTVRHVYRPPWESLMVPVVSLADGFGAHRVSLLRAAGVTSINDIDSRSDDDLLAIKGIGKAAITGLRNLAVNWPYDRFADCIEADEEYRSERIVS